MKKSQIETIETEEQRKARELVESIATNIEKLAGTVNVLINGRLKKKSLIILLAHASGIAQIHVEGVLTALANMAKDNLN